MVLGRNGLRDERRRRALLEETLHGGAQDASGATSDDDSSKRVRAKPYSEAARVAHHAPISVCLPKRSLSIWGLWLAGLGLIAVIQVLYVQVFLQAEQSLQASLTALDVTARGSLASWFAAVVMCCAAMASSLVYLIRRHRTDDYRGRYRWWLWLVPLLLLISINAGTGLHQALSGLLTRLSGAEVAVGGKGWWLIAYAAVFLPVGLQLAMEFWPSRLATAFFCGTVAAYAIVAAFEVGAVQCAAPLATTVTHSSLLLAAHFGVLLTVLAYGRYVFLEANDGLAVRKRWGLRWPQRAKTRRPKRKSAAPSTAGGGDEQSDELDESAAPVKRLRMDGPHSKFGQSADKPPQVTLSASTAEDQDDADSPRRLSKQERKRLRREGSRP